MRVHPIIPLLPAVALIASACAHHSPDEVRAECERWAVRYASIGNHVNRAAYEEDLMVTCMTNKQVPYQSQALRKSAAVDADWENRAISPEDEAFTKSLGRDKAKCIERSYVGQSSRGINQGQVSGSSMGYGGAFGSGVSGNQTSAFASSPTFDSDLFVACMNEAGWELASPSAVKPARD